MRVFWYTGVRTILTGTLRPDGRVDVDSRQGWIAGSTLRPRNPISMEKVAR